MSDVIDLTQKREEKELCIFVQRKLMLSIAQRLRYCCAAAKVIMFSGFICVLLLFYLCGMFTLQTFRNHKMNEIGNQEVNSQSEIELEQIEVPNLPPIPMGY